MLFTVDEAWDIKPPYRLDKFATDNVDEADNGPANCSELEIVDDAEEINPLPIVSIPVVEALAR